ncbi:hypothetical protein [Blastopirellula marina]|uniref:DUF4279 domain-containing protein n=1 Tax=Blastopirellula marina TaxID=124 RepID=A0A2S8F384_9BACT|nr:hypothetical protein [Blastopirellula marina]PQO26626.1 hypothetical protein C5Y98_30055 [Blastopirellula marina]PTL40937.1 hypothetical protein C5Y97_30070 [Blastopirellula marina]
MDDDSIRYLNTDLDLCCDDDLTSLTAELESSGATPLHVTLSEDARWYATVETDRQHVEPEANIAELLTAIESLSSSSRSIWNRCSLREFNLGYDCGLKPWAFNQGLSAELLARIAAAGVSLRVTLYPHRPEERGDEAGG